MSFNGVKGKVAALFCGIAGLSAGGCAVSIESARPVYVRPAPLVIVERRPPPVVYYPAPVVVVPQRPVYVAPPVYVVPRPPVYVVPRYDRHDHRDYGHGHGGRDYGHRHYRP